MSGGRIGRCQNCSRLLIVGQQCMCEPRAASRCDCTHDGNREMTGPNCRERQRQVWADAMTTARRVARLPLHAT